MLNLRGRPRSTSTECAYGHPWVEENIYWYVAPKNGHRYRQCRACKRDISQKRARLKLVGAKPKPKPKPKPRPRQTMPGWTSNQQTFATPSPTQVDVLDKSILRYLCEEKRCVSSVVLAAEVQGRTEFEWLIIENILDELNKKGLVVYQLGAYSVFTNIRPTRKAYEVSGVAYLHPAVVGARFHDTESPARAGDTTDFRWWEDVAPGGPVERMPLEDHILAYDDHDHWRQWRELKRRGVVT